MVRINKKININIATMFLATCLMFIIIIVNAANAEITSEIVEKAWSRIATADGFKVVKINYEKDDSPNAWVKFKSQDDFSVHVTKGLMKILKNEDEIAGVLGHEIGHVRCGHYNEGVQRRVGWTVLSVLLDRAGGLASAAGNIGMNLAESGFSRGQEVEADDYGTDLLVKSGYSPWGLYNAMKCFKDNKLVTQPNGFNSHPPTERRLKHLSDRAKSIEKNGGALPSDSKVKKSSSSKTKSNDKNDKNKNNSKNSSANKSNNSKKNISKTGSSTYKK